MSGTKGSKKMREFTPADRLVLGAIADIDWNDEFDQLKLKALEAVILSDWAGKAGDSEKQQQLIRESLGLLEEMMKVHNDVSESDQLNEVVQKLGQLQPSEDRKRNK